MNYRVLPAMLACFLMLGAARTSAQAQSLTHRMDTISAWGGAVNAFQRVGNIGYCGSGQRLVVLDMSNESNLQEFGSISLSGTIEDFVVRGNYLFVATQSYPFPLVVIDVSTPSTPTIIWVETAPPPEMRSPRKIRMYGNIAYIQGDGTNLVAYDLSKIRSPMPMQVGAGFGILWNVNDFQIIGDLFYAAEFHGWLKIYRLQPDPLHPILVGSLALPQIPNQGNAPFISVDGSLAAVTVVDNNLPGDHPAAVKLVDVSDPAHPALRSSFDDFYFPQGVAVRGNSVFIADWYPEPGIGGYGPIDPRLARWKGIAVLDASNPAIPALIGNYRTPQNSFTGVRLTGNRAYGLCQGQGLVQLDISILAQPTRTGGYFSPAAVTHLTKSGSYLYVMDEFTGFTIFDMSNPNVPSRLGIYTSPDTVGYQGFSDLVVQGEFAYLAAGHGGIHVVNISNPTAPMRESVYRSGAADFYVDQIEKLNNGVLVAHQGDRAAPFTPLDCALATYDISNPPNISPIGQCPLVSQQGSFTALIIHGNFGYATNGGSGTLQFDLSNPASPAVRETYVWGGEDLALDGNKLYVAANTQIAGVRTMDISDDFNPVQLGWFPRDSVKTIATTPGRLYLCGYQFAPPQFAGYDYLVAYDVAGSLTTPQMLAYSYANGIVDMVASDDYVYMAIADEDFGDDYDSRQGVLVQRYRCAADMDGDGALNVNDFVAFLNRFAAVDYRCDIDRSRRLNVNDFVAYMAAYAAGCN